MVLDLPADISAQVEEKARQNGVAPAQYAVAVLADALQSQNDHTVREFIGDNDTFVSDEEAALHLPYILRGLEAEAQGRYRPSGDVFRDLDAKYGLNPQKSKDG